MPSIIKKFFIVVSFAILGLCGFLLLAYSSSPLLPLRVGINQWPGYETLYLARTLGYIDSSSIRLVDLPSATEVIHALSTDTLEAATLTLDETLTLLENGVNLKIVSVMDISSGADALLAHPKFSSLEALKGKRIGIETGAVGAVLLHGALEQANMQIADFTILPLTVNKHAQAYDTNSVDAIVTFEPVKSYLISQGAISLFNSSQIPGRIVDVLVVRADILESRSASICELVKSQFKALKYFQNTPQEAVQLMAPRLQISPEALLESYQGLILPNQADIKKLLGNSEASLQISVFRLIEQMLMQKLIKQTPETKDLIDSRCIDDEHL